MCSEQKLLEPIDGSKQEATVYSQQVHADLQG